jgi:hypothetical protein
MQTSIKNTRFFHFYQNLYLHFFDKKVCPDFIYITAFFASKKVQKTRKKRVFYPQKTWKKGHFWPFSAKIAKIVKNAKKCTSKVDMFFPDENPQHFQNVWKHVERTHPFSKKRAQIKNRKKWKNRDFWVPEFFVKVEKSDFFRISIFWPLFSRFWQKSGFLKKHHMFWCLEKTGFFRPQKNRSKNGSKNDPLQKKVVE